MKKRNVIFIFLGLIASLSTSAQEYKIDKDIPNWALQLVEEARHQTTLAITYKSTYEPLDYPGGDVDSTIGVCTDLIVRSFRNALKFDFQVAIREDMLKIGFSNYPQIWGHKKPDSNIDHRRVPNLRKFLKRNAKSIPIKKGRKNYEDFQAGDIVTFKLGGRIAHIGIVSNKKIIFGPYEIPLIIHHYADGLLENDLLGANDNLTGHFRFSAGN